jgi:outer membrane protein OmpA-like peptidoglycan-associated protein
LRKSFEVAAYPPHGEIAMRKISSIFFILLACTAGFAQTGVEANVANPQQPRGLLKNPAAMAFYAQGLFVSGYKLYYASLGDEKLGNLYWGLSYPLLKPGYWGITGELFGSPIFRQTHLALNYAIPFNFRARNFAAGVRAGVLGVSYDSENFHKVDLDDPLLRNASKSTFDLGLGVWANPVADLYLGFSANHLNRPNLALAGGEDRDRANLNVSAIYMHPLFRPQISLEREAHETYVNFGFESWWVKQRMLLRGNFSAEKLSFGMAYQLGGWRGDYEYDYLQTALNQVSDGNHQVTLSYQFSRKPSPVGFTIQVTPLDSVRNIKEGVPPCQAALYQITMRPFGGFNKPVKLSAEKLPEKIISHFFPPELTPNAPCTLRVEVASGCPPKLYPLTVKGMADSITHRDSSTLRVRLSVLAPQIASRPDSATITEIRRIAEESPLLNYVFFAKDDDQIPAGRYELLDAVKAAATPLEYFTGLAGVAEQYRHVLNLFGRRLYDNRNLKIILVGCNANVEEEKNDLALSGQRAERVKRYFTQVWNIELERIIVDSLNLPKNPSSSEDPRSRDENRRVEIRPAPGSEEILAAFTTTTIDAAISLPACLFLTHGTKVEAGVKDWQMEILQKNEEALRTLSDGASFPDSVAWDWRDKSGHLITSPDSLRYRLRITDNCGQESVAYGPLIRMQYVQRDTMAEPAIARSRLIFFAFDKYRIDLDSPRLQSELEKIEKKFHQRPGAKIDIRGYTDDIGDSTYNVRLSERRALAVKEELVRREIPASRISVKGFGPAHPLMTNALPEGRMMNRRVEVEITYRE